MIFGTFIALALQHIITICFVKIFIVAIVYTLSFAGLSIPLWMYVQYVDNAAQKELQKIINTCAVFILFQTIVLTLTLVSTFIVLHTEEQQSILLSMPILGIISSIGFGFIYQLYRNKKEKLIHQEPEKKYISDTLNTEQSQPQTDIIERISVKHGQKIHVIPVETIQYIQAEGDYVMIYTNDSKYLKEQTMKYFESHLSQDIFIRIHRSFIVNIHSISNVQLYEKQQYIITLRSGLVIKASAGGYKLLKQKLQL
jgi:hypothetical protein